MHVPDAHQSSVPQLDRCSKHRQMKTVARHTYQLKHDDDASSQTPYLGVKYRTVKVKTMDVLFTGIYHIP